MEIRTPESGENTLPHIVCLVGPTASGKSSVAVALAQRLPMEIVSADAMQIYRGMPILSAAPDAAALSAVPHHLIAVQEPDTDYNASLFCRQATAEIESILGRRHIPLIVGGSGMYVRALLDGLFAGTGADSALREQLGTQDPGTLHLRLQQLDPAAAAQIHPNNVRRLVRALEICLSSGRRFSEIKQRRQGLADRFCIRQIGLDRPREQLYTRIEERVDRMVAEGVVAEVRAVRQLNLSVTAAQALGIRQIGRYIDGLCSLDQAVALLKRDSRRYAKRQMTWFRRDARIHWVTVGAAESSGAIAERIVTVLTRRTDSLPSE